jgi:hypothetical protein
MAQEVVGALGSRAEIRPARAAELHPRGPRRPASEALTSQVVTLRPWQEALREYVAGRAALAGRG